MIDQWPNHPAPGKAGIGSRLTIGHHCPGLPESLSDGGAHMRSRLLNYSALGLLTLAIVSRGLFCSVPTIPKLSLALAFYTNDPGMRRFYYIPDASNHCTAVFWVSNRTTLLFTCDPSGIEVRTDGRWVEDTNWADWDRTTVGQVLGPGETDLVGFPVPPGSNDWRCSVGLCEIPDRMHHPHVRPEWEENVRDVVRELGRKLGVKLVEDNHHIVWSPEIAR